MGMAAQNIPSPSLLPPNASTSTTSPATTLPRTIESSKPTRLFSLQQPSKNYKSSSSKSSNNKFMRRFRSVFRSFPIITPMCKIPVTLNGTRVLDNHIHGGTRMTGTLFGHRKARINLAIQENPKCLPMLLLELGITTGKLLQDMGTGLVRIALECEKRPSEKKMKLLEEPIWALYCNGKKSGYAVKREPTDEDLMVMQTLHPISMGAGVIPIEDVAENIINGGDVGELAYMRAPLERVVNSRDSETYYMMNPDGNSGPELSIFFVRIG